MKAFHLTGLTLLAALTILAVPSPGHAQTFSSALANLASPPVNDGSQDFVFLAESRPILIRVHARVNGQPIQQAWDEYLAYVFKQIDSNGDGFISEKELDHAPRLDEIVSGTGDDFGYVRPAMMDKLDPKGPKRDSFFQGLDLDRDGKLSQAELSAYFRKRGFAPMQIQKGPRRDMDSFVLYLGARNAEPTTEAVRDAIFRLIDADRDGRLTKEELAAAPKKLLGLDINEDAVVTTREAAPDYRPMSNDRGMMRMGYGSSYPEKMLRVEYDTFFRVDQRGQVPDNLVYSLQQRYSRVARAKSGSVTALGDMVESMLKSTGFGKKGTKSYKDKKDSTKPYKDGDKKDSTRPYKDKVKDKKDSMMPSTKAYYLDKDKVQELVAREQEEVRLSRAELGLDEATFALLDTNRDGKLDTGELACFVRRAPDVEVVIDVGTPAPAEGRVQIVNRKGKPALLADRVTMQAGLAMIDLGATRTELRGSEANAKKKSSAVDAIVRQQQLQRFRFADRDGKGYVDLKDAENNFGQSARAMDRDGDGKITEQEFLAYHDRLQDLRNRSQQACVTLVLSDESRGLFDLLDLNRDGKLGLREMRGAVNLLAKYDTRRNGYLTRADIPQTQRLTLRRGPAGSGRNPYDEIALIYGMDDAKDADDEPTAGPAWFRKMDRNRDGDVSPSEWLGSEEAFRRIDTDGDGLISVAEAIRFDAQQRRQRK